MENKFKKATRRITAVAATALMVSSSVFGASLSDYPQNFVSSGEFDGQVVIGADSDAAAATSVISDLKSDLMGGEKVKITAKMASDGGFVMSAIDSKDTLNFGETLGKTNGTDIVNGVTDVFDDGNTIVLKEFDLDNNDYTQELELYNGLLEYKIFSDEFDSETTIRDGLSYGSGDEYAVYTLDFSEKPDVNSTGAINDLKGETIVIMGNEFTVVDIAYNMIELIGGSNKISLGEGESTTVVDGGVSYEISVQSVSGDDNKVLLSVNGETVSADEHDTVDVGGITIAITDLVSSSRDAVKGYASLVVGGQKLTMTDSKIEINDEDFDDMFDDLVVDVDFLDTADTSTFGGFMVKYMVDDSTALFDGDSLKDVLFDSFLVTYNGLNTVEYSTTTISTTTDEIKFSGKTFEGVDLPSQLRLSTNEGVSNTDALYLGTDKKRIFHKNSINSSSIHANTAYTNGINMVALYTNFTLNASDSKIADNMFLFTKDTATSNEEVYLWEMSSVDKTKLELDFDNLLGSDSENSVPAGDVNSDLDLATGVMSATGAVLTLTYTNLGAPIFNLMGGLLMDFTNAENASFISTSTNFIRFSYQTDVDADNDNYELFGFDVAIKRAAASKADTDAIILTIANHNFSQMDDLLEDSDFKVYVDAYGTRVTLDTDNNDNLKIEIPNKEVQGLVDVNFGGAAPQVSTYTVDKASADAKVKQLEDDGYTVTTETVSTMAVSFDITAPVMASDVTGMSDMVVIGGPAANMVAAKLLGVPFPSFGEASGLEEGEAVVRYFSNSNSVLVYGWDAAGTVAAANKLNSGGLSGSSVDVQ